MSAAPKELPTDPDEEPITPVELQRHYERALPALARADDVNTSTDWFGRIETHVRHSTTAPRPKDLVRALTRAPDTVIARSVGTGGVSDYRYCPDRDVVIQRSYSTLFELDAGSDETIRTTEISTREAADLLREVPLLEADHWGADLEEAFERFEAWRQEER